MLETIIAGDTLELSLSYSGYDVTEWSIWIALRGNLLSSDIKSGSTGVTIDTSTGVFDITVTPAGTAAYAAGTYNYAIYLYKGSPTITDRVTVEAGTVEIRQNLAALTSTGDPRSHVKTTLDAINAVIEGRATSDEASYTIAGRSLSRIPVADLLVLRDRYAYMYLQELRAEMVAAGLKCGGQVKVRF